MKSNIKNHEGFGVVEALMVIVLVTILAGIGWFVWSRYEEKSSDLDDGVRPLSSALSEQFCVKGEDICFKHPKDWTVEGKEIVYPAEGSEAWKDNGNKPIYTTYGATVMSPGGLSLVLDTGIGQIGGHCNPSEFEDNVLVVRSDSTQLSMEAESVEDEDTAAFSVVQVLAPLPSGGVSLGMYLTSKKQLSNEGTYNICESMYGPVIKGPRASGDIPSSYSFQLAGERSKLDGLTQLTSFESLDMAKDALAEPEYIKAFEILTSIFYR